MTQIHRNTFCATVGIILLVGSILTGCAKQDEPPAAPPSAPSSAASQPAPPAGGGMAMGGMNMDNSSMKMGSSGQDALKSLSGKEFNIAFLSQMIAHHQGAVDMAKDVLKVAKQTETKTEAQAVVTNQEKEIKKMTAWLHDWYGVTPSAAQMDLVKADMKGMMGMKVTDDKMFFQMMLPHHQGAIDMSQLALKQSDKAEVKELAQQIIKAQEAEIGRYNALIKQMP